METPNFEKSFKGICCWILWKIGFVVYFLCAAFPIGLCITCIMVLAIERRSTIVLPIIMSAMLHPVVVLPIGVLSKILEGYLSVKLFNTHINKRTWKILQRLFTYSVNMHLFLIAGLIYYLYNIWEKLEVASTMNFSNKSFNQCDCDALSEINTPCENNETEDSFQNVFIGVRLSPFIITFMVTSVLCHIFLSLILYFPTPINLLDFYLGDSKDEELSVNVEMQFENSKKDHSSHRGNIIKGVKISCIILTIVYLVLALTSPNYTFDSQFTTGKKIHEESNTF